MKLFQKIKKDEKGSLTVEASISMVLFSLVMVFLLTLINASRAQAAVQNAIDKAALEISQFMYLYEATGLYYETVDVTGSGKNAADTGIGMINGGGNVVDGITDSIQNGVNSGITGEILDNITSSSGLLNGLTTLYDANAFGFIIDPVLGWVKNTDVDSGGFKDTDIAQMVISIADDGGTLSQSYDSIKSGFKKISDNPIQFVLSIAKYGLGTANSYIFGACLGETVTVNYIGANNDGKDKEDYADYRLKKLGVVDGVKGLDFRKSSVFSSTSPTDINLVVAYDVSIYPLLGDFKVKFAQSASTRAWLGGDRTVDKGKVIEGNRR